MAYVVDPGRVRPGRKWYWIGALVGLLIIVAGPAIFYLTTLSAIPALVAELESGTPTTVTLSTGKKWAVYVDNPAPETGSIPGQCEGKGVNGGNVTFDSFAFGTFTLTKDGHTWQRQLLFQVDKDGPYSITCTASDNQPRRYAIGEDPEVGNFLAKTFGGLAAVLGLACVGLTFAGVFIAVVATRRSRHRKQLQAQAAGAYGVHPTPPYQGYPPPPQRWR
jgi:hypothetical protein